MKDSLVYSNVSLKKNKSYMLYLGGLKYLGICRFLKKSLRKYYNKNTEVIYILPNFPPCHFKGNYVVLNKKLAKVDDKMNSYIALSSDTFYKTVANSTHVRRLVSNILKNQKDLFVQLYKDSPKLTFLAKNKKIKFLGPQVRLFAKYDNKLFQHKMADKLGIPVPKWVLAKNKTDLLRLYQKHWKNRKAFITALYGAGGRGCAVVKSKDEIMRHRHIKKQNKKYIISDYISFTDSPTTSAIVANENEIFFNGVMDQLLDGPKNKGSIYPSKLSRKMQHKIEEYTLRIGKHLGKKRFRGFFSLDFIVDKKGRIYFSEINPRIGGTTLEKIYFHEVTKKKGFPSLPELEFRSVTRNTFGNISSYRINKGNFSWARFTVSAKKGDRVIKSHLPEYPELIAFKKHKSTALCCPRKGMTYLTGGLMSNIVCAKKSRAKVKQELKKAERAVLKNLQKFSK
ncbi:ATP-grasp domain-containing protein [Candidatus Woesearchaeota archaeon]|nr:ATP-grasp domain-containing protein [Candidatus Woesearchaeota archaeon]